MTGSISNLPRKIIHLDMDCFYAAIEMRERPELAGKPVAVGGGNRGVLTTCNYLAREFGCRSAMPAFKAMRLCPRLIIVPVRFDLYREESRKIRAILEEFTPWVEPLSLDEAYLDVSGLRSEGAVVAAEIRERIREQTGLSASAGIAPNKFLAKVASDWNKPDGQFEIHEGNRDEFVAGLPIEKIWGVGERTAAKLHRRGVRTCADLQAWSECDLRRQFGKLGGELFHLCRGRDDREVNPRRERKSVSNERTFPENLKNLEEGAAQLDALLEELARDLSKHEGRVIREGFVKVKFADFQVTNAQTAMSRIESRAFQTLLGEAWRRGGGKSVRLIGAGVRFVPEDELGEAQRELF